MAEQVPAARKTSGVEALIARLRDDGVAAGRAEAERMTAEAEALARRIVGAAEAEAKAKRDAAFKEIDAHRRAGEDALRAAARDAVLDLKEQIARRFADDVAKTVSEAMRDEALLERMILAIVGRARAEAAVDAAAEVEAILPRAAVGLDELRKKPEELREGSLSHFVAASAGAMLREGVSFGRAEDDAGGIRLRLKDRGVSVDLTDRAVAEVILAHLQPRFRALLEGVVA
jgi:V/A-type H+-transporting ATPase subunit E